MEIVLSKSRIVYYQNQACTLKNTEESWNNISVVNCDANPAIQLCTVPGTLHNWHQIPTNTWGLYATINELLCMYENNSHIQPVKCTVSISHCIPLAKYPGTANTTQLSFNNTIYSLIYDLKDTDYVQPNTIFENQIKADNFYRSFDGASYADNSTVVLPKPDLTYKIPAAAIDTANDLPQEQYNFTAYTPGRSDNPAKFNTGNNTINMGDINLPLKAADIKKLYYPEFLQDNSNVKVLYPGENIDVFEFENENNAYGGIDTSGIEFGATFQTQDVRNFHGNSTTLKHYEYFYTNMDVFPNLKGTSSSSRNFGIGGKVSEVEFNAQAINGYKYDNKFTTTIPSKFIKGMPILDSDNNLVPHSFQCVLTHTLTIKCTPRESVIPRPLQWGYVVPLHEKVAGQDGKFKYQMSFKTLMPFKPLRHTIYSDYKMRLRPNTWADSVDLKNLKARVLSSHELDPDFEKDNFVEIKSHRYAANTYPVNPTKTFQSAE